MLALRRHLAHKSGEIGQGRGARARLVHLAGSAEGGHEGKARLPVLLQAPPHHVLCRSTAPSHRSLI